ncbi:unnamed protein product [Vicia faba]|uniref:Uncharacterized protein n=1 Tax=Vicia faba TaxID=3906 RepID=A0AAV1B4R5_VICFA|nr:unnamed protein product [Vicia faba]
MDMIDGNMVTENEHVDLNNMMLNTCLFEKYSVGDYYTWSNKHNVGIIYSRIDIFLGNVALLQNNVGMTMKTLPPSVSDHALLCLSGQEKRESRRSNFKFINRVVSMERYHATIVTSWNKLMEGRPMSILWHKLMRLQSTLKKLSKPFFSIKVSISQARTDLLKA